jgi:cyclophilin family peptidyl-prolyl cis-trans isomerase
MAVSGLGPDDSGLLLEMLESPENGKRTAALDAWMELGLPLEEERIREFSRNGHWLVPLFLAWALEDSGDHQSAMTVYDTVLEDTARYDEPSMLLAEMTSVLGLPETVPSPDMTLLPFDPDTVHVPDTLLMATDIGQFRIVLWRDLAPVTCASFTWLARRGFYDGTWFHRVIPGFVAQAGCPDATGMGGPGYTLPNERSLAAFTRGVVGMADAGLDTGGSQFFVMLDDHDRLDGRYTAFGEVIPCDGLDDITVGTRILWMGDYRR